MAVILKTSFSDWWNSSRQWSLVRLSNWFEKYVKCLETINEAKSILDEVDKIETIDVPVTKEEIEVIYAEAERFLFYCDGIHYEISEMVDNVFSFDMGALAENTIDLNPKDYKYLKSKFLWKSDYLLLSDIVSTTISDPDLQNSFTQLSDNLNTDSVSNNLSQSINDANFWKEQFELAEQVDLVTDKIFTPEVREEWPYMTEYKRRNYVERYKNALGEVFQIDGLPFYEIPVTFTETSAYGCSYPVDNHIGIRPEFVQKPEGEHSLDYMINVMTHEMRHRYQRLNGKNAKFDLPDDIRYGWTLPAVSPRLEDGSYDAEQYMAYYTSPVEADAKAFAALSQDYDN